MIARLEAYLLGKVAALGPLHARPRESDWHFDAFSLPPELQSPATRQASAEPEPANLRRIPR